MFFYDEAFRAAAIVKTGFESKEFLGRAADNGISLPWLANMAISAGSGDHVEIGTLFGASAMTVAVAKAMAGLTGTVYCIDPFEDRTGTDVAPLRNDAAEALSANIKDVQDNIRILNETLAKHSIKPVKIELIKMKSKPWPKKLEDHIFVSAYIDGLHYGGLPRHDLTECAKRTTHYIGVDNYEETYPEIREAIHDVIIRKDGTEPDWALFFKNGVFVALRKWQTPRGVRMGTDLGHL